MASLAPSPPANSSENIGEGGEERGKGGGGGGGGLGSKDVRILCEAYEKGIAGM